MWLSVNGSAGTALPVAIESDHLMLGMRVFLIDAKRHGWIAR
ncbi:hypothetical protein [Neptunomonas phycophila]